MTSEKKIVPGAATLPLLEMLSEPGGAGDLLEEFEKGRIPILEQSAPMEPARVPRVSRHGN